MGQYFKRKKRASLCGLGRPDPLFEALVTVCSRISTEKVANPGNPFEGCYWPMVLS